MSLPKGNEIILLRRNTVQKTLELLGPEFSPEERDFDLSCLVYSQRSVKEMPVLVSEEEVKEQLVQGTHKAVAPE